MESVGIDLFEKSVKNAIEAFEDSRYWKYLANKLPLSSMEPVRIPAKPVDPARLFHTYYFENLKSCREDISGIDPEINPASDSFVYGLSIYDSLIERMEQESVDVVRAGITSYEYFADMKATLPSRYLHMARVFGWSIDESLLNGLNQLNHLHNVIFNTSVKWLMCNSITNVKIIIGNMVSAKHLEREFLKRVSDQLYNEFQEQYIR